MKEKICKCGHSLYWHREFVWEKPLVILPGCYHKNKDPRKQTCSCRNFVNADTGVKHG